MGRENRLALYLHHEAVKTAQLFRFLDAAAVRDLADGAFPAGLFPVGRDALDFATECLAAFTVGAAPDDVSWLFTGIALYLWDGMKGEKELYDAHFSGVCVRVAGDCATPADVALLAEARACADGVAATFAPGWRFLGTVCPESGLSGVGPYADLGVPGLQRTLTRLLQAVTPEAAAVAAETAALRGV